MIVPSMILGDSFTSQPGTSASTASVSVTMAAISSTVKTNEPVYTETTAEYQTAMITGDGGMTTTTTWEPPVSSTSESDSTTTGDYEWTDTTTSAVDQSTMEVQTSTTTSATQSTTPVEMQRTVILMERPTKDGEDLFIRGGIDHQNNPGRYICKDAQHKCARLLIRNTVHYITCIVLLTTPTPLIFCMIR